MTEVKTQNRKTKKGEVLSNKMQKTVVVRVKSSKAHPKYGKVITRYEKLYAHFEGETPEIGAEVTVVETRPLSKLKRWLVTAVTPLEKISAE
jgi:small subunit ribosomal protein S17